jgi:UDP-N-acetylmuramate--alanine ligase
LALLSPFALGLLNVEADHLDHYGSIEHLEDEFVALLERTSGPVVVFNEPGARRVAVRARRDTEIVSFDHGGAWRVIDVVLSRGSSSFSLVGENDHFHVDLRVTGRHNVANAATVAALARRLGFPKQAIVQGLADFDGAPRRFEHAGTWRDAQVIDDYAHLPGEVRATISAARASGYQRIGVVFQPHRYTRTERLGLDFADAFEGVALLIVTEIYGAGESNPAHVSGDLVADAVRATSPSFPVYFEPGFDDVVRRLGRTHEGLDLLLLLGAGDVGTILGMLPGGIH